MAVLQSVEVMKIQGISSLTADGAQDSSSLEARCVIIRYIEINSFGVPRAAERAIGVFTTGETDGRTKILVHLSLCNIHIDSIIGQSYDGAGNMFGKYTGLITRIHAASSA
jgi:hypothetical protein